MDQLSGAVSWNATANQSEHCLPVMVAKSAVLDTKASAPPGSRIITTETLATLRMDVLSFVKDISIADGWKRQSAVQAALDAYALTADRVVMSHSVVPEA